MTEFQRSLLQIPLLLLASILLLPIFYGWQLFQRPSRTAHTETIAPGITYRRQPLSEKRPVMMHITEINLQQPGLEILVTPGNPTPDGTAISARLTSQFLQEFNLDLAVNASYFYEFRENHPFDYYPYVGDRVSPVGQAISQGQVYSKPTGEPGWGMLCILAQNQVKILSAHQCPAKTREAVAGNVLLLENGQVTPAANVSDPRPYSRVGVGLDRTGKRLWVLAIDGKQPLYSEGLTLPEFAVELKKLGADRAINLDGGGSTTLVAADLRRRPRILNAPIQTHVPMRERPVANHLGFRINGQ